MTPSKTLFYLSISFIIGISLASIIKIPQILIWGFLILGILMMVVSFVSKRNNTIILGCCILFLVFGVIRFQISEFNISHDKLSALNDKSDKITLVGQIIDEPDIRDNAQKLKLKIDDSLVLVTLGSYPEYNYLDTIKITGKLKTPAVFDNFNYKNYLMKDGIYSVMDFPKVELIPDKHHYNMFTFLYEKILFLKGKLMRSIDINFSPPNSDILKGVVFGNDKNMSKNIKDEFNMTGLSHLTAVSGSNIVILISVVMVFLLALGLWRGQAFYFTVIFIWIYIILIGFPISGIRAAIMGCVALLAQKLGRQNTSARIIAITAFLMLLQNPLLLFYDISFQLSFLASMGIIYLKPLIDNAIKIVSKERFKNILDIISVTFAAQIFTLPIIVYNFGRISLIAPITNMLVLPIIPLLTILGFLVSILGMVSNILGFIFSVPCWFLLGYLLKILDIFSKPWAVKTIQNISWVWLVIYYVVLLVVIKFLQKYQKPKFLGY